MLDRDIEDTRQPQEAARSECDMCGALFDTDDLTYVHDVDYWMCIDCFEVYQEGDENG